MSKYIIKNCPAIYKKFRIDENCELYIDKYRCNHNSFYSCQDCTDCVMKQIVEKCKENLNSLETYVDVRSLECVTLQNILKLLDLQEVE